MIPLSEEQRFGDGQDNYLQGMRQAAEAARQFGSAAGGAGAGVGRTGCSNQMLGSWLRSGTLSRVRYRRAS